jgi:hypothetical protein
LGQQAVAERGGGADGLGAPPQHRTDLLDYYRNQYDSDMLVAILGALGDILRVAVVALGDFALLLERTPLGVFWPVGFLVVFQLLASILNVFVWWWRGTVWPIDCAYPRTTTKGRKPCRNRVLGEWHRCHLHHTPWLRRTDRHPVNPNLRRWETIGRGGVVVERTDAEGSGFVRKRSNLIGVLYYKGFARPPRDVVRLIPQLVRDYRQRFGEIRAAMRLRRAGRRRAARPLSKIAGASHVMPGVVRCTQFVLLLLGAALAVEVVAVTLGVAAPSQAAGRVPFEYAAAFLLFLAASAFRGGILGRRRKPGVWEPHSDWLPRAWREATATFLLMLVVAWAYALLNAVKSEIPGWLVLLALLLWASGTPPKRRRTRRRWVTA